MSAILLTTVACSGPIRDEPGPDPNRVTDPGGSLAAVVNGMTAPALAAMIRSGRDQALRDGARRLPAHVRSAMRPYFDDELLEGIRWTTSGGRFTLDTLLAGSLEYGGAVTFDNVIVFFNEEAARNPELWVHELHHVKQYRELGVDGFARAYVANWREMESQAMGGTHRVVVAFNHSRIERRGAAAAPASPEPGQSS